MVKNKSNKRRKDINTIIDKNKLLNLKQFQTNNIQFKKGIKLNHLTFLKKRQSLPIYKSRSKIIETVKNNLVTIIVSETGSGKSTQIPQYLLEEGLINLKDGAVAITQPRRVACITLAERVSLESGSKLGNQVGYSVRFDYKCSDLTLIKYLTDGMMLKELLSDPNLLRYKYIILDEAHERTLRNDILLGRVKSILDFRKNVLKQECHLIIMSATLDSLKFSKFFNNAPIIEVPGRGYKVEIFNVNEPVSDYVEAAVIQILQLHTSISIQSVNDEFKGQDILVFLPGQEEIEACHTLLSNYLNDPEFINQTKSILKVFPLYAGLQHKEQSLALKPSLDPNVRKCILATNIAETSLTIPDVKYIIDSGVAKYRSHRCNTGIETLQVQPISLSGLAQRAGRAGREGPGICFRLLPKQIESVLLPIDIPEILRCNLDSSILTLIASGVNDLCQFQFLDPPSKQSISRSLTNLISLKAIDNEFRLTEMGKLMSKFPLDPKFSKVLLSSKEFNCSKEILLILSVLSVDNLFYSPKDKLFEAKQAREKFFHSKGDHLTYLNVIREFMKEKVDPKGWCQIHFISFKNINQAKDIYIQLKSLCKEISLDPTTTSKDDDAILKCLLQGCFLNIAIMDLNKFKTLDTNQEVKIHPSSLMIGTKANVVMFNELIVTANPYLRGVSVIQPEWLKELLF